MFPILIFPRKNKKAPCLTAEGVVGYGGSEAFGIEVLGNEELN